MIAMKLQCVFDFVLSSVFSQYKDGISRNLVGWGSYPSVKKELVYSTAPADWAIVLLILCLALHSHNIRTELDSIQNDPFCTSEKLHARESLSV